MRAQIGAQLGLAPNTVSTYRVRILEKTGTTTTWSWRCTPKGTVSAEEKAGFVGLALQTMGTACAKCRQNPQRAHPPT